MSAEHFIKLRQYMVMEIAAETIYVSARIGKAALGAAAMEAVGKVPRHDFVPVELQPYAYANVPLPIGFDKTISQPFIVALMMDKVYSVEIVEELAHEAKLRLGRQGYKNIEFKLGNGYYGWPEHAPFDKIMVCAAPDLIPGALLQQLKPGGKMAIPTGIAGAQQLLLVEKDAAGAVSTKEILPVRFAQLEGTESTPLGGS